MTEHLGVPNPASVETGLITAPARDTSIAGRRATARCGRWHGIARLSHKHARRPHSSGDPPLVWSEFGAPAEPPARPPAKAVALAPPFMGKQSSTRR